MNRPHALITGGSSGIGFAVARRLLARGMNLTLIARRSEKLREARDALLRASSAAAEIVVIPADVAIREQVEAAMARAVSALGPPHLVVTAAGIATPGYFEDLPVEVFERTMAVNYLGAVYVVKAAVPSMRATGGRIVLISSGAGLIGVFGYTAYSPTKFALRGFAEALHAELRHDGIGVSVVFPPDTDTPQLLEESRTKPAETAVMTRRAGLWSPEAVAESILTGIARGSFAITPGLQLTTLYRFGSLLAPFIQSAWARRVRILRRGGGELATNKE